MKFYQNHIALVAIITLSLSSCGDLKLSQNVNESYAQSSGHDLAIFYPPDYDSAAHRPSFAIVHEPNPTGPISETWELNVNFTEFSDRHIAQIRIDENTDLYGTGEVTGDLIRNGNVTKLWNTDNFTYTRDNGQRLYQSHPWVLGVREDGSSFGILADNTWKMEISMGENISFSSEGPAFRVIIIEKESPQDVLKELGKLTGTIQLPPLWSLGFHQCRWSYYPDSRVKEVADSMRLKQIPCDVIWMDIHYMDDYKIFTFDPERFPNPEETNDYLHSKGFKSIWMIDPGVKLEEGYSIYDSGTEIDAWVKTKDNETFVGPVWPGDCVFPDFTQPKVSDWWVNLYQDYMATGIDGVWNDMNEPAVFDAPDHTMPENNIHKGGGSMKKDSHLRYHNVYGMMMVEATRKGILKANPDKRPFVLTRANHLGGQRYAATWTGDNSSTWDHLEMSIPMSLNLGLSGQPFNGPDIGGFEGNASPELYANWIAIGAFYPFCRAHSIQGSKAHEPWSFGKEVEQVSREALQRRYRILPYLYTLFWESSQNGMPVMRPFFFNDPGNKAIRNEQEAFLLGSDLAIIPKWRESLIPLGEQWRTVSLIGENSENHSYHPDVKIRSGAIVPMCNLIQNTTEFSIDTLTLMISLDSNNTAQGLLYTDSGEGFAFQKGDYALTEFKAELNGDQIILHAKNLEGESPLTDTQLLIELITDKGVIKAEAKIQKTITIKF